MKKNMGSTDKAIRIVLAVLVGILYLTNVISGTAGLVLGIFACILVATSFISFCPLYAILNTNTCKTRK
ncbi:DUF2892 domain-containing protein [Flavobacterium sp. DGU11]|uniref:DUF2892 domain-containing protein n=1 Tax=Flavobacterium arundinis TaxID=3139143 RepID=A0ABU9I149_9FLAO